jgi:hypothetical protein
MIRRKRKWFCESTNAFKMNGIQQIKYAAFEMTDFRGKSERLDERAVGSACGCKPGERELLRTTRRHIPKQSNIYDQPYENRNRKIKS